MIQVQTLEVAGIEQAMRAMRNPMDSWARGDTGGGKVGKEDKALTEKLIAAGPEHAKHIRLIQVWADVTAPLYWWKEFDTYRAGVEKVSCSTMHTITKSPFKAEMFSGEVAPQAIEWLEIQRGFWMVAEPDRKAVYWRRIVENLPSGFLQRRTVMMSYAALRQIYKQRNGHRLTEWHVFRVWAAGLPEGWMITEGVDE